MENVYSRHIQISGYVRQTWPKYVNSAITGTMVVPFLPPEGSTIVDIPDLGLDQEDAWIADMDGLTLTNI
jgi:hypothetical protein